MINARNLTTAVEDYVREVLSAEHQDVFRRRRARLQPGGHREFAAVSDNGRVVASVKTASTRARHPADIVTNCITELYFLSLARANKKFLVLTSVDFHELFLGALAGKVPHGVQVRHIALPPDLQDRVASVQRAGTDETQPVLDVDELRGLGGGHQPDF